MCLLIYLFIYYQGISEVLFPWHMEGMNTLPQVRTLNDHFLIKHLTRRNLFRRTALFIILRKHISQEVAFHLHALN